MGRDLVLLMAVVQVVLIIGMPHHASGFEFEVGGDMGWKVPPSNSTHIYNKWASENRFRIGDTLHFKYNEDSVMVVSEWDYYQCNSSKPQFYYNSGDTVLKIDRSDLYYFISGISGHCEKGQRMIIKVLSESSSSTDTPSPPPPSMDSPASAGPRTLLFKSQLVASLLLPALLLLSCCL